MMRRFFVSAISRAATAVLAASLLVEGCHGSHTSIPSALPSAPFTSNLATAPQSGTVQLPSGTASVGPLTVSNSIDSQNVDGSGHFTLNAFSAGPQFTVVVNQSGTPMLMGFLGSNEPQISAHTTAEVLVYFAAGIFTVSNPLRQQLTDSIPNMPGFSGLENAIASALSADPNAFAATNPTVANALQTLLASIHVSSSERRPSDILVNPSNAQSGITTVNDAPQGVHFMNNFRRPADAFIDRMYYVDSQNNQISVPEQDIYPKVAIAPATGLGSLTNTITSIFDGWYENKTYPYAPTTSATQALDLYPGSKSTRYQITVVGPGKNAGALNQLGGDRLADQQSVTTDFVFKSLALPMVTSILIPYGSMDDVLSFTGGAGVFNDYIKTMTTAAPDIFAKANSGDIAGSLVAFWNALAGSSTARNATLQMIKETIQATSGLYDAEAAAQNGKKLLDAMKAVDALLTTFDSGWIGYAIWNSDMADVFNVDVTATKIVITPASASTANGQSQVFTVTVPSLGSSGASLAYAYQNTAKYGHLTDNINGHTDNFTSTSNTVTYTANLAGFGTDTITVQVTQIDGNVKTLLGQQTATATTFFGGNFCNGNFSQELGCWTTLVGYGTSYTILKQVARDSNGNSCVPSQDDNPYLEMSPVASSGNPSYGYVTQTFTMPSDVSKITLRVWSNSSAANVTLQLRTLDSQATNWNLGYFKPPMITYYDAGALHCATGHIGSPNGVTQDPIYAQPITLTYDFAQDLQRRGLPPFAGRLVELSLSVTDGLLQLPASFGESADFDDVYFLP